MINDKKDRKDEQPLPNLSGKESVVLEMLLAVSRELYGLEMVEASAGHLKRGTIYVTLQRMEEKGLIESRQEARPEGEIGIARRLYKATGLGARAFAEHESRRRAFTDSLVAAGG